MNKCSSSNFNRSYVVFNNVLGNVHKNIIYTLLIGLSSEALKFS